MHRCGSAFFPTLAIAFVLALPGCLGKGSSNPGNGGVTSVTLSPGSAISIDTGATQVFTATGKDANGRAVLGVDIQYIVAVPQGTTTAAPLSIATNGNACAGTWDASVAICSPGTPGVAIVTAVINGVSSPPATVYVHQHIESIQISRLDPQGPPLYECFSQEQVWGYQAVAYSNGVDITNTVGPVSWSSSNASVVNATSTVNPLQPSVLNQAQVTAKTPGITNLFATVSGTTSAPYPYTTCLIQAIYLQIGGQGQAGNAITVNNGTSVPITATAVDTLYKFTGATLKLPPLAWSTTNPEVAGFTTTTNSTGTNNVTTRANFGGATVFASCTPPTCNVGVLPGLPIYASDGPLPNLTQGYGTISIDVVPALTTTKPATYTAWAATTDCQDAPGCSSALFAVTPGLTPVGTIISVPRTPNSMMFNHVSSRLYFGSDQGLMYVDLTAASPSVTTVSSAPIPCNVSLCGKLLTISNDGRLVVVSDTVSTPSQVYIYSASGTSTAPVDLVLSNAGETATAAAFSPDQLKLFILTNLGNMYIYSTVDALTLVSTFAPGTDVEFSADGSFAYVAGAPVSSGAPANSVSAFSTCSLPGIGSVEIPNGSVATLSTPLQIFPSPAIPPLQSGTEFVTQKILALEPPNIEILQAEFTQVPIPYPTVQGEPLQLTCNPPAILSFTEGASFDLGQGSFTPIYTQLVGNGTELLIIARKIPAVLLFNVGSGTTTSIPLVGNADPLSASASTDGSQLYVAACDQYTNNDPTKACAAGSVHIVNTVSQGDYQQVPYVNINDNNNPNMCNSQGPNAPLCLPNLIAIKPQ